jgi:polyhydroxybutyrate depolymerase
VFKRRQYKVLTPGHEARTDERRSRTRHYLLIAGAVVAALVFVAVLTVLLRSDSLPSKDYSSSVDTSGQDRHYSVHLPAGYKAGQMYPLLLAYHGYTQAAQSLREMSGFDAVADQEGFIVVYPEGFLRMWEVDDREQVQVDDLEFFDALLARLQDEVSYDPSRVYAAGFSQGGFFSFRLACERSDQVAAVASVGGSMTPELADVCQPDRPVPVLMVHGADDPVIPYDHGLRPDAALNVPDVLAYWAVLDRCGSADREDLPDTTDDGATTVHITYTGCEAPVAAYVVEGGGHTWPGAPVEPNAMTRITTRDFSASQVIWDFFAAQSLDQ